MKDIIPELVSRFVEGDREAFAELVRLLQPKLYAMAFRLLGNHLDADEVVQETLVRVYKRRKELRDVKYFSTFVLRIGTNYGIDILRKRKGHSGISDDITSLPGEVQLDLSKRILSPEENLQNKRLMQEILVALDQLPPKQKMTAVLHDLEGYSKAEIAEAFECPEATVRSNLHIARTKLKKILKQRLDK